MVVQHVIDIDFVARNNTPVVHLTQYDDGLPYLVVRTFQNGAPLVLSSDEVTASLRFTKPDGNFILSPGTVTETEVGFKIPSSMTVFQGKYPGKVELKDTIGQIICSATIVFDIDMNPVQKDAVESDSDYKDYIDQVLGKIPGFDGYSKAEADAKFATIENLEVVHEEAVGAKNAADQANASIPELQYDIRDLKDKKLDKVTSAGTGRVYGVNSRGQQVMRNITGYLRTPATLLYRENNGDCTMQDPIGEYSIANKRYVDNLLDTRVPSVALQNAKIADHIFDDNPTPTNIEYVLGIGEVSMDPGSSTYVRFRASNFATVVQLNKKFDIADIVQTTGNDQNKVMSQSAISDELFKKAPAFTSTDNTLSPLPETELYIYGYESDATPILMHAYDSINPNQETLSSEENNGLMRRKNGQSQVLDPTTDYDIVNLHTMHTYVDETVADGISNRIDAPTIHNTNAIGSSEVSLQSGKRYFIEGTDGSQSPQITMSLNNVTAKTNIEVFCKFAHSVILAFEHPNTTIETYGTGDLEAKITALNETSRTGVGYLHLRIIGLQDNQCAVLISN